MNVFSTETYEELRNYRRLNEFDKIVKKQYKRNFFSERSLKIINEYISYDKTIELVCNCGKNVLKDDITQCCFQISGYDCNKTVCFQCKATVPSEHSFCLEHITE